MTSRRWPAGTLRAALIAAHEAHPWATAPKLAIIVGADTDSARQVLRQNKIVVPIERPARLMWTPEMKRALIHAAHDHLTIARACALIGVVPQTLALGALEVIRDQVERP
ncbi:MAG TPA: hypothetical protein VN231_05990 [Allosphingosinicella sp.]|nr:hypothetical protein [Allosphingosinicella sp.]